MPSVWPLRPNWRGSYGVTYQFKTEIITSRSGREQRNAQRQTPRKTVDFLITAHQDRFRALMRTMATQQGEQLVLPEMTTANPSLAAVGIGGQTFQIANIPLWLAVDEPVVLVDGDRAELRFVQGISGGNVTFASGNAAEWPAGTLLCHALYGRLMDGARAQQIVKGLVETRIDFEVDPGSERARVQNAPDATWNGREVFLYPANWEARQSLTFSRTIDTVDYGSGPRDVILPTAFGAQVRQAAYLARNRIEAARLRSFFERMKGRRGEFYAPTDEPDIKLAANLNGGSSTLQAVGVDLAAAYGDDPVHKAVSFLMADGQRFYRAVTGITVSGGRSLLALAQPAPFTVTSSNVTAISWLPVCRHASDEMTLEWETDQVATTRFSFQTLEALPAE